MADKLPDRATLKSVLGHGDLATSLILVFPLFLAYQIGAVFSNSLNGVDFVTRVVFAAVDHDRTKYLLVQLGLAVVFLIVVACAHRQRVLSREQALPVVLESAIYALTLGSFIVLVMQELFGFAVSGQQLILGDTGEAIVVALGAGVHEELVFRLGLMAGGAALLCRAGLDHRAAMISALIVSALIFSFAHHIGPHGEALRLDIFTYRALAGVVFGLVFYYRSLAHAVYTHFLYDLYVLAIRP
ncbi:MAG: CPBP family intramembrane metalloprotease [Proteobacteria bacterium]|nr:CPBP family intramembrane metalloprotease [Pseudomonadota bacterium]